MNTYEKQTHKAKVRRVLGYSLLWFFLAFLIWFVSSWTGKNYPMDSFLIGFLILIGLARVYQAAGFYKKEKEYLK